MHRESSSGIAGAAAIMMIGLAVAMGWLLFTGGFLGDAADPLLDGPLAGTEIADARPAALVEGMRIESAVQFSQPRDPFRPLITEGAVPGAPGTGVNGGAQQGQTITLQEINEVDGTLRATVIVDGVTYIVGVGDTFAGTFQVVSLDEDSGVFLNGDNAFELSVGQQILK
jgi:hypothetical protein